MTAKMTARLTTTIPPPAIPIGVSGDWKKVEEEIGFVLPSDYKELVSVYGSGVFQPSEIYLFNLLRSAPDAEMLTKYCSFARDVDSPETRLDELHATSPIFPFGADCVNSVFFWLRQGDPENWSVICVKERMDFFRFPGLSVSGFLTSLFVDHDAKIMSLLGSSDGSLAMSQIFVPAQPR